MAVNKVIYGGTTLVDLTGDTVTASDLADGVKATGADGNPIVGLMQKVTIDAELSATTTNPVRNRAIKEALESKLGKTETAAAAIRDGAGNNIVDTYAKKTDISGVVKSVNGVQPDTNGNVAINVSGGGGGVSTSVTNTWTAQQNFHDLMFNREKYTTYVATGSDTPTTSTMLYTATSAFMLSLVTLAGALSAGQSSVFTAYFTANANYTLIIANAGTIKYIGNASDVAITSAGLLLNIMMLKDNSGNLTSIVQASKLS